MVPGWSEREALCLHAWRQDWLRSDGRDGRASRAAVGLHRVAQRWASRAGGVVNASHWLMRHGQRLPTVPEQLAALRHAWILPRIIRGETQ